MVAKIITAKGFSGVLNYNEKKVNRLKAAFLHSGNLPLNTEELDYNAKMNLFKYHLEKQPSIKTNTLHICLSFDQTEKLNNELKKNIADDYLKGIGFENQPYLVYDHYDSSNPHLHIITTHLNSKSNNINIHNIGKNKSEPTRKIIEKKYNLIEAEGRISKIQENQKITIGDYSKAGTKDKISIIVRQVLKKYSFTSFNEFNLILESFNIKADTGTEGSAMHKKGGLVYRLLDNGKMYGHSIKASNIFDKPTLKNIEEKYEKNKKRKEELLSNTKKIIDNTFKKYIHPDKLTFKKELEKENIEVIFRTNEQGLTYGIQFINHIDKIALKGSELGKNYSALKLFPSKKEQQPQTPDEKKFNQPIEGQKTDTTGQIKPTTGEIKKEQQPQTPDEKKFNQPIEGQKTATTGQIKPTTYQIKKEQQPPEKTILENFYITHRKDKKQFFYESTLINNLDNLNFHEHLLKTNLKEEAKTKLIEEFKIFKKLKLPELIKTERENFKIRALAVTRFINDNPNLNLKDKLIFLYSNDIEFKQNEQQLIMTDVRDNNIKINIPNMNLSEFFKDNSYKDFKITEQMRIPFTITEKKIFEDLGKRKPLSQDPKYATAYRVSYQRIEKYAAKNHFKNIQQTLNENYLTELQKNLNTTNPVSLINSLITRGMLIKQNDKGKFYIGYYKIKDENFLPLPEKFKELINQKTFSNKTQENLNNLIYNSKKTISAKFDTIVKINQFIDNQSYHQIPIFIKNFKEKNPELFKILNKACLKLYPEPKKEDPNKEAKLIINKQISQIICNAIMNYNHKNLFEDIKSNKLIHFYIQTELNKLTKSIKFDIKSKEKNVKL